MPDTTRVSNALMMGVTVGTTATVAGLGLKHLKRLGKKKRKKKKKRR